MAEWQYCHTLPRLEEEAPAASVVVAGRRPAARRLAALHAKLLELPLVYVHQCMVKCNFALF